MLEVERPRKFQDIYFFTKMSLDTKVAGIVLN